MIREYWTQRTDRNATNILVIEIEKAAHLERLFDIVAKDGTNGKKAYNYWVISTSTDFMPDGMPETQFYNTLMYNAKERGYAYIQITFK